MLWHDDGHFIQALEGKIEPVTETFVRILADKRHTAVDIVINRPIMQPMFGAWSMIHAEDSKLGIENAVFLYGLARDEDTPGKRRMREVLLAALK